MIRTWKTAAILSIGSLVMFTACDDDDDDNVTTSGVTIPTEYESPAFVSNAVEELAMTAQLASFTSVMKKADAGETVTLAELEAAWDGTSLRSASTISYRVIVDNELSKLATASTAGTFDWSTAPNNDGGNFEGRTFNAQGLESVQLVEKGLFGAALFHEAIHIVEEKGDDLSAADIDRLVALFGTTPAFPNSDKAAENPDKFTAKYSARRTPSAGGLYLNMKGYFIEAKAYAEAGSKYNAQKAMAIENLMKDWEKSISATTINYLYATVDKMSQTNPDDATIEDGMHAYAEGVGFLSGLYSVSASERMISDEAAEHALEHMKAPFNENPESYLFVTDAANELAELTTALDELQEVYGFSNEEMEDFKKNWVTEENR